jgi:integrase
MGIFKFNVARKGLIELKGGAPTENPVSAVEFLEGHNVRDRVLTPEEFARMLGASPDYLKPVLQCAYYTGMRKGELLGLTWDRVDLKAGFIRLKGIDTKISEARSIPIGRELRHVLQSFPWQWTPRGTAPLCVHANWPTHQVNPGDFQPGVSCCRAHQCCIP